MGAKYSGAVTAQGTASSFEEHFAREILASERLRVGMLAEMYPDLDHREICQMLVRAELAGGLDVALAARGELDSKPAADAAPTARARKQPH